MKASVRRATRPEVLGGLGGFAGMFDASAIARMTRPVLATSTDGVGTKVAIAQALDIHDTIGFDLVGMVVDDIVGVRRRAALHDRLHRDRQGRARAHRRHRRRHRPRLRGGGRRPRRRRDRGAPGPARARRVRRRRCRHRRRRVCRRAGSAARRRRRRRGGVGQQRSAQQRLQPRAPRRRQRRLGAGPSRRRLRPHPGRGAARADPHLHQAVARAHRCRGRRRARPEPRDRRRSRRQPRARAAHRHVRTRRPRHVDPAGGLPHGPGPRPRAAGRHRAHPQPWASASSRCWTVRKSRRLVVPRSTRANMPVGSTRAQSVAARPSPVTWLRACASTPTAAYELEQTAWCRCGSARAAASPRLRFLSAT